ncbi:hypothetical protein QYF36_023862 [Acer negundo]|nr:hypothetical protein QYF36_023862 [Acer negundo]
MERALLVHVAVCGQEESLSSQVECLRIHPAIGEKTNTLLSLQIQRAKEAENKAHRLQEWCLAQNNAFLQAMRELELRVMDRFKQSLAFDIFMYCEYYNGMKVELLPMHLEMVGGSATPMFYSQNEATSLFLEDFDIGSPTRYHYVLSDSKGDNGEKPVDARPVNMLASSLTRRDNSMCLHDDALTDQN